MRFLLLTLFLGVGALRGQDLYFVHVDSVYAQSIFGEKGSQFADSVYAYHHNYLLFEVKLLLREMYDFAYRQERCCGCNKERLMDEYEHLAVLQARLTRQEVVVDSIRGIIENRFKTATKSVITELAKSYADSRLTEIMILDSSQLNVFGVERSHIYYLTERMIADVNHDPTVKSHLNELAARLEVEIEQLMCGEY